MNNLIKTAQNWLAQDPDVETRQQLQTLIDNNDREELAKRFSGRLQFGTAGLRGPLQAGAMGMNRVLVAQAAAGLARFLIAQNGGSYEGLSMVVGYDARKNSKRFAEDTAEIMQGMGIDAYIMPDLRPTPVLAFAVRELKASAGVMVTASHNPPQDNGYKVYLGGEDDGAQIVSPNDKLIAEQIQWVADNVSVADLSRSQDYGVIAQSVIDNYIDRTANIITATPQPLNYVYTAMHGVGKETLLKTVEKAGLPAPILVNEQCEPDGTFPTVAFPNPEEAGALDLAIAKAKAHNAEFIIANDPDADRLAVAVADDPKNTGGEWHSLHGNEVGLYLAWFLASKAQQADQKGVLACSLVSSPLLGDVAKHCGMDYQETLTGFKWVGRIPNLLFGYEEALGYLVNPSNTHDKDGISAIVCFLDLINTLKAKNKSFADYRQDFVDTFGAFTSDQISIRVEDLSRIGHILSIVRQQPFTKIAAIEVEQYIDHLETAKASNILVFHLAGGQRVIFRPSGTEPKLKIYLDTKGETLADAKMTIEAIKQDLEQYLANI